MFKIVLDTNILHQEGFESKHIQILTRLTNAKKAVLIIPEFVKREYLTKRVSQSSTELKDTCRTLLRLSKTGVFSEALKSNVSKIVDEINSHESTLSKHFDDTFEEWIDKVGGEIAFFNPYHFEAVIEDYFSGEGAFRKPKNREDIPDGIIYYTIEDILEDSDNEDSIYVVVKDGNFKQSLEKKERLIVKESLLELFQLKEFEDAITELDAESVRIKTIKEYLQSDACGEILRERLLSNKNIIEGLYLTGEDIIYDKEIFGADVKYIELFEIVDIDDMEFGRVDFLSDETYSIEIEMKATANCLYGVSFLDYHLFREERKADVSCESVSDEVCELEQKANCAFRGNIEIIVTEKMKLEELSIHIQYLNTDVNPIIVLPEFTSAKIIELVPYSE